MPGQYGNVKVTVQNLEIVKVDAENNLIDNQGRNSWTKERYSYNLRLR